MYMFYVYMLCVYVVCMCCVHTHIETCILSRFQGQPAIQIIPHSTFNFPHSYNSVFRKIIEHGVVAVGDFVSCSAVAVFENKGFYLTENFCLCLVNIKALFACAQDDRGTKFHTGFEVSFRNSRKIVIFARYGIFDGSKVKLPSEGIKCNTGHL